MFADWGLLQFTMESVNELSVPEDAIVVPEDRVRYRQSLELLGQFILFSGQQRGVSAGPEQYETKEYRTPKESRSGCGLLARVVRVPAGELIVGKIHRYPHLNFLMEGTIVVSTEDGMEELSAPRIIVSEKVGTRKAGYAVTDVLWATVHLYESEDLESELIAKNYAELGMSGDLPLIGGE